MLVLKLVLVNARLVNVHGSARQKVCFGRARTTSIGVPGLRDTLFGRIVAQTFGKGVERCAVQRRAASEKRLSPVLPTRASRRQRRHHRGAARLVHAWGAAMTHRPHVTYDRAGRRNLARWQALDRMPAGILPPRACALAPVPPAVPRQACRRSCRRPAQLLRRSCGAGRPASLYRLSRAVTLARRSAQCIAAPTRGASAPAWRITWPAR